MAKRRWYEDSEFSLAQAHALEDEKFLWYYSRQNELRDREALKSGFYVGRSLPAILKRPSAKSKLIYQPR